MLSVQLAGTSRHDLNSFAMLSKLTSARCSSEDMSPLLAESIIQGLLIDLHRVGRLERRMTACVAPESGDGMRRTDSKDYI